MNATSIANTYWANFLGIPERALFQVPLRIVAHHTELSDYRGAYGLLRNDRAMLSLPADSFERLKPILSSPPCAVTPTWLAGALANEARLIVGPAWIGYATEVPPPIHPCRALGNGDTAVLQQLRDACDATEWDHGGSSLEQRCSGVFAGGSLVALAGYEVWGGTIAHIAIVTHPAHRGRGYGRSAVAHLARRARDAGLLPQYRTLVENRASIRIGETLGFLRYGVSLAVRF